MTCTRNRRFRAVFSGRRMERIPERGLFLGVLAGIADYTDWSLLTLRIIFMAALLLLTTPAVIFYGTAALVMPRRIATSRLNVRYREIL